MNTRLHLVRHGETEWNAQKRYQGSRDIPLNSRGRVQAQELAEELSSIYFAGIYSSTLSRAKETAEIIRGSRNLEIENFEELQEGCFGSLEGKTYQEIDEKYSDAIAKQNTLTPLEKLTFKIIPDEESWQEVLERALPILTKIGNRHPGEDVLIVAHGGVIRTLLVHLADHNWSGTIKNGELVTFGFEDNQMTHLPHFSFKPVIA